MTAEELIEVLKKSSPNLQCYIRENDQSKILEKTDIYIVGYLKQKEALIFEFDGHGKISKEVKNENKPK